MTKPHTVIVVFEARPQKELHLKSALMNLVSASQHEQGCLEYRLKQGKYHHALFVLYKRWQDNKTYQEHLKKPHFISFMSNVYSLIAYDPMVMALADVLPVPSDGH